VDNININKKFKQRQETTEIDISQKIKKTKKKKNDVRILEKIETV